MPYEISTTHKKCVTEVETWTKDGETLKHSIGWRWGSVTVDDEPDLSDYDPETDEIDVYGEWGAELISCDDGCWEDWEYPESWTEEDIEKFQEAWEEEWHQAPLDLGWREDDTALYFSGPLEVKEIEEEEDEEG